MKILIFTLSLLLNTTAHAEPFLKVAILDTGIRPNLNLPLCSSGHKSFSPNASIIDIHPRSHGSNIASLIQQTAGNNPNYCLIIIKILDDAKGKIDGYINALEYVSTLNVNIINLSLSGSKEVLLETIFIKRLLNKGVSIVAAAGNDSLDFDRFGCIRYPACVDKRIIVVGNSTGHTSNKGSIVDLWIDGSNKKGGGVTATGTSQAAAIATGLLIKQTLKLKADEDN